MEASCEKSSHSTKALLSPTGSCIRACPIFWRGIGVRWAKYWNTSSQHSSLRAALAHADEDCSPSAPSYWRELTGRRRPESFPILSAFLGILFCERGCWGGEAFVSRYIYSNVVTTIDCKDQ